MPCIPAADGIDIMTIFDAIYESARTGHAAIIRSEKMKISVVSLL